MADKPLGKSLGEHAEGGDEKFQNERFDAIETYLEDTSGGAFKRPVQTTGADAPLPPETEPEAPPA